MSLTLELCCCKPHQTFLSIQRLYQILKFVIKEQFYVQIYTYMTSKCGKIIFPCHSSNPLYLCVNQYHVTLIAWYSRMLPSLWQTVCHLNRGRVIDHVSINFFIKLEVHYKFCVAQSVGHLTRKSGVLGSIPGLATYFRFSFRFFKKGSCQLLAKVCARSTG